MRNPVISNACYTPLRVSNEEELLSLLSRDVVLTDKSRAVFLAGHFPLYYNENGAYAATEAWGAFTKYSLDLACRVAREASASGKDIGFVLLADDINQEDTEGNVQFSRHQKSRMRNTFYGKMSGPGAALPSEFQRIFDANGMSSSKVIRQDHGKKGRENSLFHSERILRASRLEWGNECAKAYRGLVESPSFDKEEDYLVAFVPDRCTGNICLGVLDGLLEQYNFGFTGSNVAMQTDSLFLQNTDAPSIWKNFGVTYRKDSICG